MKKIASLTVCTLSLIILWDLSSKTYHTSSTKSEQHKDEQVSSQTAPDFELSTRLPEYGLQPSVNLEPGIHAPHPPKTVNIKERELLSIKNYSVIGMQQYEIQASVLSIKEYHDGQEADFSPVDFALGWEEMSDPDINSKIQISQSDRFYNWYANPYPIPRQKIILQSANTHIIPFNGRIENDLKKIRVGQIIYLPGYLVRVHASNENKVWISSFSRSDTGAGACELMLVTNAKILKTGITKTR